MALLPAGAAFSEQTGFYVGGDVGNSTEHFDASTFNANADNTGYKAALGIRPLSMLAAEVNYVSFGRATGGENFADTDGVGVSALAFLPIPIVDIYGRLGVINWRTSADSPGFSFHRTGSDLTYGVGVGAHWGNLGARAEFEKFEITGTRTMDLTTVGLTWTFGWFP